MTQNTSPSIPVSDRRLGTMSVFDEQKPLSQYMSAVPEEDTDSTDSDSLQAFAHTLHLQKLRPISTADAPPKPDFAPSSPLALVEYPLYDGEEENETDSVPEPINTLPLAITAPQDTAVNVLPDLVEIAQLPDETVEPLVTEPQGNTEIKEISPIEQVENEPCSKSIVPVEESNLDVITEEDSCETSVKTGQVAEVSLPEVDAVVVPEVAQEVDSEVVPEVLTIERAVTDGEIAKDSRPAICLEPQISIFPDDSLPVTTISFPVERYVDTVIDYQYKTSSIRPCIDGEVELSGESESIPQAVVQTLSEVGIISDDEVDDVCGQSQSVLGQYPIFESFVSLARQKRLIDSSFFFDPAFDLDKAGNEAMSHNPDSKQSDEMDGLQDICRSLSPRQRDSLLSFLKTLRTNSDAKRT